MYKVGNNNIPMLKMYITYKNWTWKQNWRGSPVSNFLLKKYSLILLYKSLIIACYAKDDINRYY